MNSASRKSDFFPPGVGNASGGEPAGASRGITYIVGENNCTVINTVNGSLASDWENIPETIILNGTIGLILLGIFLWLTHIAWRRADSNDLLKTQNIVTFLYGYRDPERWYVIPRLEFLRHEDRHHQHDMNYPNIYVPPKLPLANPLEVLASGRERAQWRAAKSADSGATLPRAPAGAESPALASNVASSSASSPPGLESSLGALSPPPPPPPPLSLPLTTPQAQAQAQPLKQLSIKTASSVVSEGAGVSPRGLNSSTAQSSSSMGDANNSSSGVARRDSLRAGAMQAPSSFFYPSILTAEQLQATWLSKRLNRFFGKFFRVTDADMIYSRGIDAYEYLLFQRHLIFIMFVATLLCLGVILPIHWIAGSANATDTSKAVPNSFQRSTIKNIVASSHLHWAHIVCSGLIVVITLKVMSSYIQSIMSQEEAQISRRTLLVGNIPSEQRSRVKLMQIFREHFPRNSIVAIQFVYDTRPLDDSEMYLSATIKAKEYCQAYKRRRNGQEIQVHRQDVNTGRVCDGYCRCCSFLYICCCFWPCGVREPGSEYYAREEQHYRQQIAEACAKLVREPTEYAFVTFRSHKHARRVMSHLASMKQNVLLGSGWAPQMAHAITSSLSRPSDRAEARAPAEAAHAQQQQQQPVAPAPPPLAGKSVDESLRPEAATAAAAAAAAAGAQPRPAHKFLESSICNADDDPLDPKNNPHVRSIRSPVRGSSVVGASAPADASKEDSDSQRRPQGAGGAPSTASRAREASKSLPERVKRYAAARPPSRARASFYRAQSQSQSQSQSHLQSLPLPLAQAAAAAAAPGAHKLDGPLMWSVRYAPHPDNVEFSDLLNLARTSRYTIILLHVLMIIIFIFVTTPNVILSMIERLAVVSPERAKELTGFQGLMINYFSILLQISATAILPALITLISKQIPYEDSSTKGHSVMWKVYSFLVLMVIVMPSIGMSSAQALFETDIDPKCLFPTDNGAYYINYVISSIFLSTILELIKPADILFYYFVLWTSRSLAEVEGGRQFIEREFSVNMQHTQVLLIFSVVLTYSISCPLIAPVGLLYLCVKHAVDHYNLYYTYFTKKVDKDLQSTIVIFVKVALLLMLFQTTVAIYINTGTSYFALITQMIFWITLAALVFNCFFDCTSRSLPSSTKRPRYHNEFCACFYLPKVISNLLRSDAIPHDCISRKV